VAGIVALMLGGTVACAGGASDRDDVDAPAVADGDADSGATTSTVRPTTTTRPPTTTTGPAPPPTSRAPALAAGDDATVARIVDGDTLWVGGPGSEEETKIRLIGIDTPEVAQDGCYAGEATAHLSALVGAGTPVRLVYDVERFDRYDRTLAYVFRLDDGLHANVAMAQDGYAQQLTIPPNVAYRAEIGAEVAEARAAGRGLWGAGCETSTVAPQPLGPSVPAPAPVHPAPGVGCDPSYPGVCIPPAPPDLDCPDVPHRRFAVVPPDPHGFDGNGDGVGCER
jgi:micrococcal nuclease